MKSSKLFMHISFKTLKIKLSVGFSSYKDFQIGMIELKTLSSIMYSAGRLHMYELPFIPYLSSKLKMDSWADMIFFFILTRFVISIGLQCIWTLGIL
jgi:hypothetical protein